jgi:hypothetical protein
VAVNVRIAKVTERPGAHLRRALHRQRAGTFDLKDYLTRQMAVARLPRSFNNDPKLSKPRRPDSGDRRSHSGQAGTARRAAGLAVFWIVWLPC